MATHSVLAQDGRDETSAERLDRNTMELLNELRVAATGIQVMFGFLLIVPFNVGWRRLSSFGRTEYFVTLICIAVAAVAAGSCSGKATRVTWWSWPIASRSWPWSSSGWPSSGSWS